jgi:hypothetical protein
VRPSDRGPASGEALAQISLEVIGRTPPRYCGHQPVRQSLIVGQRGLYLWMVLQPGLKHSALFRIERAQRISRDKVTQVAAIHVQGKTAISTHYAATTLLVSLYLTSGGPALDLRLAPGFPKFLHAESDARLDGPQGDMQIIGDLLVRHAIEIGQFNRLPLVTRQPLRAINQGLP